MNHIRRKKGVNILKTFKKIIAVLLAGAGSFASAVPAMAAQPSYFTYTVKLPGKKAKTYSSRKTLNLSSAKASKSNAVIKLKSVYLRGRKASSSGMKISCMYTSSNGHIVSDPCTSAEGHCRSRQIAIHCTEQERCLRIRRRNGLSQNKGYVQQRHL